MIQLKVNPKSRLTGLLFGLILVFIIAAAGFALAGSPPLFIILLIIVGPIAFISLSFGVGAMLTQVDEKGFAQRSLFWTWKRIDWDGVKNARLYSPPPDAKGITPGLLLEVFDENQKIIISPALVGPEGWWEQLLNMVRQRIPQKLNETDIR